MTARLYSRWQDAPSGEDWRWPHFEARELACKCAGRFCAGEYFHDPVFLTRLEAARLIVGRALKINSGRRCRRHNAAVGGAALSQHSARVAVDISVVAWPGADRKKLLLAAHELGFGGVGYARTFLHLDARPLKPSGLPAQWDYQKGGMAKWLALLT